jgi:hypothetical protein
MERILSITSVLNQLGGKQRSCFADDWQFSKPYSRFFLFDVKISTTVGWKDNAASVGDARALRQCSESSLAQVRDGDFMEH